MLSKSNKGHACSHRRKSSTESSIPGLKARSESIMDRGSRYKSSYFTLKSRASLKLIQVSESFGPMARIIAKHLHASLASKNFFSNTLQYFQRRAFPGFQMPEGFF